MSSTAQARSERTFGDADIDRYTRYTPADLAWLSERPAGWKTARLGFLADVNPSKGLVRNKSDDLPVSFVPMDNIEEDGGLQLEVDKALGDVIDGYTYFRNGDVLVAKITPCFENGKGALAKNLRSGIGFGTTELHVLRPHDSINPRFLFYVTMSDHFRSIGAAAMYGAAGQKRVPDEFITGFKHPLPPKEQQRQIAEYLDAKTRPIEKAIRKKKRLIELLEEKRTALITRAVTKGLDPDLPMKDSGVEWLGKIPEGWDTTRVGYHVDVINGEAYSSDYFDDKEGMPLIRIRDLGGEDTEVNYDGPIDTGFKVQPGDVLIGMDGDFEVDRWSGEPALLNQRVCSLQAHETIDERFLYYSLPAPLQVLNDLAFSTTVKHLSSKEVRRITVAYPPKKVQRRIGKHLENSTHRLDRLIERIQSAIELLREYRQALITQAVTGKIDVRDHAA